MAVTTGLATGSSLDVQRCRRARRVRCQRAWRLFRTRIVLHARRRDRRSGRRGTFAWARKIAAERIHRAPDLNDDFLKEILAVGVLERIRMDHLEQ